MKVVSTKLREHEYEALRKAAELLGKPVSEVVRVWILERLGDYKEVDFNDMVKLFNELSAKVSKLCLKVFGNERCE